jgi:hypothetical protein
VAALHNYKEEELMSASEKFRRDTLVYLLGNLAERIVINVMQDSVVRIYYEHWLSSAERPSELELLTTGMEDVGAVKLVARGGTSGEFYLACLHPEFEALVLLGFESDNTALKGLCIAEFEGSHQAAIQFVRRLSDSVEPHARHMH